MAEAETRPARRRTGPGGQRTAAKGRAPADGSTLPPHRATAALCTGIRSLRRSCHPPHQPLPLLAAVMPAGIRLHAVVRPAIRPDAGPADYTESSHLHPHHPHDLARKNKRK